MGKKSKKGVSRAGAKARPKSGSGKQRRVRSGSKQYDSDAFSIDSSDPPPTGLNGKVYTEDIPDKLNIVMNSESKGNGATETEKDAPTDEEGAPEESAENIPLVQKVEAVTHEVANAAVVNAAEDALRQAESPLEEKTEKVEDKQPEAVPEKAKEVLPEKPKEVPREEKKEALPEKFKEVVPEKVIDALPTFSQPSNESENRSRGLALDEPAAEEAAAKQKDCGCIIL